jgi:hypothetical protein
MGVCRRSVGRLLTQFAAFAGATAATLSCAGPVPVGVDLQTPALLADRSHDRSQPTDHRKSTGLLACSQTYDSATRVIGSAGGYLRVGNHTLFVYPRALPRAVRITAVAPADTVRWVRFQPDGLVFQTSPASHHRGERGELRDRADAGHDDGPADHRPEPFGDVDGWGAILYTSYKDCGVLLNAPLRVAQVTDSKTILGYLTTFVKSKRTSWSDANQFVAAVLPHFSNYAIAW